MTNALEWVAAFSLPGRHVKVKDGTVTYCASIPDAMSLDQATDDFASDYDFNGNTAGNVGCTAYLYNADGDEIETQEFCVSSGDDDA